jgi:dienelactone hydrolase
MIVMLSRLTLALLLLASPAIATPLTFDASTIGGPVSNQPGELYLPAGNGSFPGMVVLHGCDGIGRHYREWAQRLASWGYATILVDSFRPRGVRNVCNEGMKVPPEEQAADAFAAAAYLRTLPTVRGDHIGVIGFSHGGWAVLKAVLSDMVTSLHATPFAAAVAFYPGCSAPVSPLVTDTLIMIGSDDDWTPPQRCERWHAAVPLAGHTLNLIVYPGAVHGFDAPRALGIYAGHHVGRNEPAAEAAIATAQQFLKQRLMPGR